MKSVDSDKKVIIGLSVMMFLQFFIWGSWFLTIPNYIGTLEKGFEPYWAYTAGPIAAIISPFFLGLFADRFFNTEKVLAILFLLSGVFIIALPCIATMESAVETKSSLFNLFILLHMICYMPTLALTASLSFAHLPKGSIQFPIVRLWGTFGWIFAGLLLPYLFNQYTEVKGVTKILVASENTTGQFYLAGFSAIALGFYAFFLPKTPAPKKGEKLDVKALFFMDVWKEFKVKSFAVFVIVSFLVCIPLQAYYAYLQTHMGVVGLQNISVWKNVGTWIEAFMMFGMAAMFYKLGVKKMIAIGIGAWVLRYVLFALAAGQGAIAEGAGINISGFEIPYTDLTFLLLVGGIALHGLCYDFFFVTGQVYVDQVTDTKIRGQAQSMLVVFTQGIGMLVGAKLVNNSLFANAFGAETQVKAFGLASQTTNIAKWSNFWYPLAVIALVVLIVFLILFKHKEKKSTKFSH